MSETELAALAASIQRAWESGRVCSLIGRGARARVVRIGRLVAAGHIDRERATRLARETEAAVYCFAPLPAGDVS